MTIKIEHNLLSILEDTVRRTYNTADSFGPLDTQHGIIGLFGEVGELSDTIKRHLFYGREFDRDNALEKVGGILYYVQALALCFGLSMNEIVFALQEKLQKQYPSGFTTEDSILRKDKNQD